MNIYENKFILFSTKQAISVFKVWFYLVLFKDGSKKTNLDMLTFYNNLNLDFMLFKNICIEFFGVESGGFKLK